MEEKLKKLEEIKKALLEIDLEKELTEKDKDKYVKNLEQFEKMSTDAELYDEVKKVVEETEGKLDNPTTGKSLEELKRIDELQKKYKSVVKENIAKKIEVIEKYAEKFDMEELLENKQGKITANDQAIEKNTKARVVLEKLQMEIKDENDKYIECDNVSKELKSIQKAVNEAEKIQTEIDALENDNTIDDELKNSQIELRKNKMNKEFEKINKSSDKYNKMLDAHKLTANKLPEVKELSEAKALQITAAEIVLNAEKANISDNITKIKDAKEKELQELGIGFDDAIEGHDLNEEINKKKTELRLQKSSLKAKNESLKSTIDAIHEKQTIINEPEEEKDEDKIKEQYKKDVEQKADEKFDKYLDLSYREKVKLRYNVLEAQKLQEGKEVKGIRKAFLRFRSLFGANNAIDNYMLEEAKEEVADEYKKKAEQEKNETEKKRQEAEAHINNFKDQYKVDLINRVMSEKDLSKIDDGVVDKIYDDMNEKDSER